MLVVPHFQPETVTGTRDECSVGSCSLVHTITSDVQVHGYPHGCRCVLLREFNDNQDVEQGGTKGETAVSPPINGPDRLVPQCQLELNASIASTIPKVARAFELPVRR
jgi:hypothetical protein